MYLLYYIFHLLYGMFLQVTRVVLLWVNNHFVDFETDAPLCEFLENFEGLLEREVSNTDKKKFLNTNVAGWRLLVLF